VEELQGYFYSGTKQNNQYTRTTKAIADYCGSRMSPGVWDLIINGEERKFVVLVEPTGRVTEYSKVRYSREVDMWLKNKNEYEMDKARLFILIRGQCVKTFRDILESHDTFDELSRNNDVAGLLALIRELTFENKTSAQYDPYLIVRLFQTLFFMKQGDGEDAVMYYQYFLLTLEALESVAGGSFVPFKHIEIVKKQTEDSEIIESSSKDGQDVVKPLTVDDFALKVKEQDYEQFKTCLFLNSLDRGRYKDWIDGLDTSFVAGNDYYPKTLREAFN
jgi:hypothetical protein